MCLPPIPRLLETWQAKGERWRLVPDTSLKRCLPSEREDGTTGKVTFVLMPQWVKVRWRARNLVPSKLNLPAQTVFG